ncbi:hypothetical protein A2U01_0095193, partial [Trifolium medium]|nr:hypothetical protein [Trifolium medium]MCI73929.1 hypothetical protein [Trifolium medium]
MWGTQGGFSPPNGIFSIPMSQESNPDRMLKGTKTLTTWT